MDVGALLRKVDPVCAHLPEASLHPLACFLPQKLVDGVYGAEERQSALISPTMFVAYSLLLWHLWNFNILLFIHIL